MGYVAATRIELGHRRIAPGDSVDLEDLTREIGDGAVAALIDGDDLVPAADDPIADGSNGPVGDFLILLGEMDEADLAEAAREIAADDDLSEKFDLLDALREAAYGPGEPLPLALDRAQIIGNVTSWIVDESNPQELTVDGAPKLDVLRRRADLADITTAERDAAVAALRAAAGEGDGGSDAGA